MAGRILIAGGDVEGRNSLAALLRDARYDVLQADGPAAVQSAAAEHAPDLILLDEAVEDQRGVDVCRKLKNVPALRDIPVILSAARDDTAMRSAALEAGADELLRKPHDEVMLMARLRSILRLHETSEELRRRRTTAGEFGFAEAAASFAPAGRIAFVTTGAQPVDQWRAALAPLTRHRMEALGPDEAREQGVHGRAADVYVLDASRGGATAALRMISDLRSRPQSRHAAILAICARGDTDSAAMALDLGANDLVPADFDTPELALRLRTQLRRKRESDTLRQAVDEDLRLAVIDPLTGLYNRRYAMAHLKRVSTRAAETGRGFAVMVADLDRFKDINDRYGHPAGDAVLVEVAKRLCDNLRGNDLVARIGGEEFLVAMPDCDLTEGRVTAERLCRVIDQTPIALPDGQAIHATLSIGVSVGGGIRGVDVVAELIDAADKALYGAKSEGRNQVTVCRSAA